MDHQALETQDLAILASALFDVEKSERVLADRFAAVLAAKRLRSSLVLHSDQNPAFLRGAILFLQTAPAQTDLVQGFGALTPTERALLVCAHILHWSYPRMALAFNLRSPEDAERMLWTARLNWAARINAVALAGDQKVPYPAFSPGGQLSCPEQNRERPWFQRFLDEEWRTSAERMFLEAHLVRCPTCAQSLKRAKEFFFALDGKIAALDLKKRAMPLVRSFAHVQAMDLAGAFTRQPVSLSRAFVLSLWAFVARWDVRIVLFGLLALTVAAFTGIGR